MPVNNRSSTSIAASQNNTGSSGTPRSIEIGERYLITWKNGSIVPGEIIETRASKKHSQHHQSNSNSSSSINNNSTNQSGQNNIGQTTTSSGQTSTTTSSAAAAEVNPEELEYYVHYMGYDRRLDEWVTYERINIHTYIAGGNEENEHSRRHKKVSKRKYDESSESKTDKEALLEKLEKEHEEVTKVKNINSIVLGKYEIETWYFSPYPDEYCGEDRLYLCEYCLKYMKQPKTLQNHMRECNPHRPPGRQIYSESDLAMYEIDGKDHKIYCQNLCLLSKLFLDHKTLYYDVDPFMFYVLCEVDNEGSHIVGYFSKEKHSQEGYNLACISTFPPYQRKGYGKFLISVSYEISKRENTTGSPEKPLSDLGKISYRSYWAFVLLKFFQEHVDTPNLTLNEIGRLTGIRTEDILSTLHALNFIRYWKGQHVIQVSAKEIDSQLKQAKLIRLCNPACLDWSPPEKTSKKA